MKKLILLIALGTTLYACNQRINNASNTSQDNKSKSTVVSAQKQTGALNIDMVQTSPNQARVLTENEHVRVVEYSVKPGEKDVWHTHPPRSSYVISGGKVKVYTENDEPKISEVKTGASSWAGHSAKHYVENVGDTEIKIILTEIKSLQ